MTYIVVLWCDYFQEKEQETRALLEYQQKNQS